MSIPYFRSSDCEIPLALFVFVPHHSALNSFQMPEREAAPTIQAASVCGQCGAMPVANEVQEGSGGRNAGGKRRIGIIGFGHLG